MRQYFEPLKVWLVDEMGFVRDALDDLSTAQESLEMEIRTMLRLNEVTAGDGGGGPAGSLRPSEQPAAGIMLYEDRQIVEMIGAGTNAEDKADRDSASGTSAEGELARVTDTEYSAEVVETVVQEMVVPLDDIVAVD